MIELIANFHFPRPWWLLALLPAAVVWWRIFPRADSRRNWLQWVEPQLLDALLLKGGEGERFRPIHALVLAGPTWQRIPSPFAEDEAALVMVLKVTPSMEETDIAPSRLQRATEKISDLLTARPGTSNRLIVYAGGAHLVMPLTTDANVINTFARGLSPKLMPKEGDDPVSALNLAERQLDKSGQPGAILFITDEFTEDAVAAIGAYRKKGGVKVHVWAAAEQNKPAQGSKPNILVIWGDSYSLKRLRPRCLPTPCSCPRHGWHC